MNQPNTEPTGLDMHRVMKEGEAAAMLGVSLPHLRLLRRRGEGPAYVKRGLRAVGYRPLDIVRYTEARVVQPSRAEGSAP